MSKGSTDDIGCEALDMSLNSKFGSFKRVGGSVCVNPSTNVSHRLNIRNKNRQIGAFNPKDSTYSNHISVIE